MAESALTGYEAKLVRELKLSCSMVDVIVLRHNRRPAGSVKGQGWSLEGRQNGALLIELHSAFLTAACTNFQKAYDRAVAGGLIKKGKP